MPCADDLGRVEHGDRRGAAAVVLQVQERVADAGGHLVEQRRGDLRRSVDQDGDGITSSRASTVRHVAHVVAVVEDLVEVDVDILLLEQRTQRRLRVPGLLAEPLDDPVRVVALHARRRPAPAARAGRTARRDVISRLASIRSAWTVIPRTTRSVSASTWSSRIVESGRTIRSALECVMSRSCQSATFSSPTWALPRRTRARPQMRSQTTGLRLCGIALEPFWPLPERLLDLAHLGALQVADLGREALQPGAGQRDRAQAAPRGGRAGRPGWRSCSAGARAFAITRSS